MKKLVFTAFAVLAISTVSKANSIEDGSNCDEIATTITNQKEAAFHQSYGLCFTSSQYNSIRNQYRAMCKTYATPVDIEDPKEAFYIDEQVFSEIQP
ncbi:hypothetical protein AAYQ05_15255 [Flavobacterium sp. B11]|uniref:hypothetical protein n=1 Tax=Flavobacterium movens TaxID=214860 RepID=UPI0031CDF8A0